MWWEVFTFAYTIWSVCCLSTGSHCDCLSIVLAEYVPVLLVATVGLVGDTELECARGDMLVDCVDDMRAPIVNIISGNSEESKVRAVVVVVMRYIL